MKIKRSDGTIIYKCPGCGKEFENGRSFSGHTHGCKGYIGQDKKKARIITRYVDGERTYTCPGCGLTSTNMRTLCGHVGKCRSYLGEERYQESLARQREYAHRKKPGRSIAFAEGRLTPNTNYGRPSRYKDNYFRSSYEAIYAVYLLSRREDIHYEDVRLLYNGKAYISDFRVGRKIIEIKGYYSSKCDDIRKAFTENGYEFEIIYSDNIWDIFQELSTEGINIQELYDYIMQHSTKEHTVTWDFTDNKCSIIKGGEDNEEA